ncbi:MAG: Ldh family oxidoreductase [Chloroflexi bacterium]|nr:Ldh family oxidoreductase [Chloroflexota bacterium]
MLLFTPEELVQVGTDIFRASGTPERTAAFVARSLVDANLAGHDSHGAMRIVQYVQNIRADLYQPTAVPKILRETATTALVDGAWGFGQETAHFSMELAIRKARESHLAAVSAIRSNHIGRLGEWAEQAASEGMIGLATVCLLGHGIGVAPFGGAARSLANNPIAIAFPSAGDPPPVLLDFATSASAEGKVRVARDKGAQLPPGFILDKEGRPTTNPNDFYAGGMLLPFGGHKGYALSVVVELLSTALGAADLATDHAGRASGSFYLCIDPRGNVAFEDYAASLERSVERIVDVPPAPGVEHVVLPGEPEVRSRAERRVHGIGLPEATWAAIVEIANDLGVAAPTPRPA